MPWKVTCIRCNHTCLSLTGMQEHIADHLGKSPGEVWKSPALERIPPHSTSNITVVPVYVWVYEGETIMRAELIN
jgi:hypothetical protein